MYGSSKQGKTSLRKFNLTPDDYISVTCSNTATLAQLHSAILKEAGYTIEQSTTRTASGEAKINAKIIGDGALRVSQVDMAVVAGHAVLTGVVDRPEKMEQIIHHARAVEGIVAIKSFLQLKAR